MESPGVFTEGASFGSNSEVSAIFSSDNDSYCVTADTAGQAQLSTLPDTYVLANGISGSFDDMIK